VKTNIEKIGGVVDVHSRRGFGTTFRIKIPLTLAIIPALIVTSSGERYAIPQVSLLELVRLEGEHARTGIKMIQGAPVYRLRGRLLPLIYLRRELGQGGRGAVGTDSSAGEMADISQARQKHIQWLGRVQRVIDGLESMTPEQAGSYEHCPLGLWLYGPGMKQYGGVREMQQLEAAHQRFHAIARGVVTHRVEGHAERAQQGLNGVRSASKEVVELLGLLEARLAERQSVNIVVLQADQRQFGLVVDDINDTEEIVVKPLSKQLKSINVYAGATIMGDGKVALILDVMGLAQRAHVTGHGDDHATAEVGAPPSSTESRQSNAVLLFQNGENGRMAVDLSQVARLEEFPADAVETAGDQEAVQYRGQIMPLIRISDVLPSRQGQRTQDTDSALQVVVYSDQGRRVGLVVERILDIIEESFVVQRQTGRKGILGSAVIQRRITDILDVPALIESSGQTPEASPA